MWHAGTRSQIWPDNFAALVSCRCVRQPACALLRLKYRDVRVNDSATTRFQIRVRLQPFGKLASATRVDPLPPPPTVAISGPDSIDDHDERFRTPF